MTPRTHERTQSKGEAEVTPQQALRWMGFIEQRTTEIVQFYQVLGAIVQAPMTLNPNHPKL